LFGKFLLQVAESIDVKTVMDTWIKQKGYPVIEIKGNSNSNTKIATQTRFLNNLNPSDDDYENEAKG
jgi:aminopeptidase N